MPRRPPVRKSVLKEIVLSHVRWYEARTVPALEWNVVNDYGSVTRRSIYRNLATLAQEGEVVRILDEDGVPGYVRARPPRWDRFQQVYT